MKTTILSTIMLSALALTACSDETYVGDTPKDWAGTTEYFQTHEDDSYITYYKPAIGRVGDPMPFFDPRTQDFKILYLQEFIPNDPYCFHPFYGLSTYDGANYTGLGEILPTGRTRNEADAALGTGCAVYDTATGLYYIYYTGHTSKEIVMRAVSADFVNWTKDKAWTLKGSDYGYSDVDFRDPQVFKAEDGKWHMVISSNLQFAEFVSDNLKDWSHVGRFNMVWDRMCECPDIFKMGDWWYLVYSEGYQTDWSRKVKYMKADSWQRLKECFNDPGANWPDDHEGVLDTRTFYAGKTASNGKDRYIWGWAPYRSGADIHEMNLNVGSKEPNWSGALVCHKLIQHENGTLSVGKVPAIEAKYTQPVPVNVMKKGEGYTIYSRLGTHNHISFTAKAAPTDQFGISFVRTIETKTDDKGNVYKEEARKYYSLVLEPDWDDKSHRKVFFEQNGVDGKDRYRYNERNELNFIHGAEGYCFARPDNNEYKIDIFTDNSVVTMYINGEWGTTYRIHGAAKNCWSINTYGNPVEISNVQVLQY